MLQSHTVDSEAGRVNVGVANIYQAATYRSEIVSQALLNEKLSIIKKEENFSQVEMQDGYSGWISNYQWVPDRSSGSVDQLMIRSHLTKIFSDPDESADPLRDVTLGCWLKVSGRESGWVQVELPDGLRGWVRKDEFGVMPGCSRTAVVSLAREFLGCPYFWGGRSPKGFDCSGLIQRIFGLFGVQLPRDAWMQHRDGTLKSSEAEDAGAGDLYFFAESGAKITHVGLALGEGRIIHARGYVRLNSLRQGDAAYSPELRGSFIDVRSFL